MEMLLKCALKYDTDTTYNILCTYDPLQEQEQLGGVAVQVEANLQEELRVHLHSRKLK